MPQELSRTSQGPSKDLPWLKNDTSFLLVSFFKASEVAFGSLKSQLCYENQCFFIDFQIYVFQFLDPFCIPELT